MSDYHINVFWSDEDDCYNADIPDLEFCSAHEEALSEVLVAKRAWLGVAEERGLSIPKPRYRPLQPPSRAAG